MPTDVLVIEDSQTQAIKMKLLLEQAGYSVRVCKDSIMGLEEIRKSQPRLVLLDIELPSISGLQLLRMMKHAKETANIPVIIMSHRDPSMNEHMALTLGAVEYLPKHETETALSATVERILSQNGHVAA